MSDPNLRCQLASVATLPPTPDGNRTSNIATDISDIMLSTETELTQYQVANVAILPLIPYGNRISNIATEMADIMLSTETELTPYQVANVAILPLIRDGNRIRNIATDMADIMLSTKTELARSKRPRGAQGWYAGPSVETEMNAAWQQREKTKRRLRVEPHNSYL